MAVRRAALEAVDVDEVGDRRQRQTDVADETEEGERVPQHETDDRQHREEKERARDEDGHVYLRERRKQFEVLLLLGLGLLLESLVLVVEVLREALTASEDAREVLPELLEALARGPGRGPPGSAARRR